MKSVIVFALLTIASYSYPYYKQCDPQWKDITIGDTSNTICAEGTKLTCVAMAFDGAYDPKGLNDWLKEQGKYD